MKKIHSLLAMPAIYAGFMIYKTPNLSDSIIVAALSCVAGFVIYVSQRYAPMKEVSELGKLKEELELERTKLHMEQVREAAIREKTVRDSRAALAGFEGSRKIQF